MKKLFLMCLAILLSIQGVAAAEQINVAVEVIDTSKHQDFGTANHLENFLSEKLTKKNLINVINTRTSAKETTLDGEKIFSEEKLGEILIFDSMELPTPADTPENFDQIFYKNSGVDYVIRCEVLAIGLTKVEDKTISTIFGTTGALVSVIGSGSGSRNKTLRRVGFGIGLGGFFVTDRTALSTVVNMQFISVETGQILWQRNFMGLAVKHHKPRKNYTDAWTQAYMESVGKTAELISKQINKYVDKVLIKGKSDEDFRKQKFATSGGAKRLF